MDRVGEPYASLADSPLASKTVLIDPGHGGDDSFQVGRLGVNEADYVDTVADHIEGMLRLAGANVVRTRRGKATVPVSERTGLAVRAEPTLAISLHLGHWRERHGLAAWFSWRHGCVGRRLAKRLLAEISAATGLPVAGLRWRQSQSGEGYQIVRACRHPAVVVEIGQLGSTPDEAVLSDPAMPHRIADGILTGLLKHLGLPVLALARREAAPEPSAVAAVPADPPTAKNRPEPTPVTSAHSSASPYSFVAPRRSDKGSIATALMNGLIPTGAPIPNAQERMGMTGDMVSGVRAQDVMSGRVSVPSGTHLIADGQTSTAGVGSRPIRQNGPNQHSIPPVPVAPAKPQPNRQPDPPAQQQTGQPVYRPQIPEAARRRKG